MPAFSLPFSPGILTVTLHPIKERSSTTRNEFRIQSFGGKLEPRTYFGAESLDQ